MVQMMIAGDGRRGVITSVVMWQPGDKKTGVEGYWVMPEGETYIRDDVDGLAPVGRAKIFTATHWSLLPDGRLHGLWFDAPLVGYQYGRLL